MVSKLRKTERLATGLTQQDTAFRDALESLSGTPANFYTTKQQAYNRLNHALVGIEPDYKEPVTIVGLFDNETGLVYEPYNGHEVTYTVDELDPEYVRTMNEVAANHGLSPDTNALPLTDLAMELLDELHDETTHKPKIDEREYNLDTKPRRVLQRAFENEILFNIQLQRYIDQNDLSSQFDSYSTEMTEMIGKNRFESSFNDGLLYIDEEMSNRIGPEVEQ